MASKEKWEQGLPREISFWEDWLAGRTVYPEDRALRLSSGRPFPWWAKPLIRSTNQRLKMLDVGAGPVTALGNVWDDKWITIVPIDPLAEQYREVLQKYAITPPTPTIYGLGETLLEQFGPANFDFAYACNCLDHALDPVECYRQMLAVLKPGCSLVTFHEPNEAENQKYDGLHQWNFSEENGRYIIWNNDIKVDLIDQCDDVESFSLVYERKYFKLTITKKSG